MAVSLSFPRSTMAIGVHTVGPRDIPMDLTQASIEYDISQNTNPATIVKLEFVISISTGDKIIASQTFPGGVLIGDGGVPVTQQVLSLGNLEEPANPNRTLRAVITVTGAPAVLGPGVLSAS